MGLKRKKTKTLENQLAAEITISFPIEIIQEILSRLPVKPLLQFRSVSQQWLSLISDDPCFRKLHFTRSRATNRMLLFITAYDRLTDQQHLLSAAAPPCDGGVGHVTRLMTLPEIGDLQSMSVETEHLNGLILFTTRNGICNVSANNNLAFVINPSTRNIYKLPHPPPPVINYNYVNSCMFNFFGFDESINQHKVLNIRLLSHGIIKFMVFSLSDYSWTKGELLVDIKNVGSIDRSSVCVNSVIHMMLQSQYEILAFDLRTYKFKIIKLPDDAIPHELSTSINAKRRTWAKSNHPILMKTNGLLALGCHDRVVESNEIDIWILQDYENRVWVRETVAFSKNWIKSGYPYPLELLSKDEILFSLKRYRKNRISVPIYDIKTRMFKSVKFIFGPELLLHSDTLLKEVGSYVECILPFKEE